MAEKCSQASGRRTDKENEEDDKEKEKEKEK